MNFLNNIVYYLTFGYYNSTTTVTTNENVNSDKFIEIKENKLNLDEELTKFKFKNKVIPNNDKPKNIVKSTKNTYDNMIDEIKNKKPLNKISISVPSLNTNLLKDKNITILDEIKNFKFKSNKKIIKKIKLD